MTMRSPWDGLSRAPLRVGLAIVAAFDLLSLANQLRHEAPGPASHPLAPGWLLGLGGHAAFVWGAVALAMGALVAFAAARAPLRSGVLALAVLALFAESHAAIVGGPQRNVFASGAALLGWLCGLAWGRGLGATAREDLAEAGAIAAFAATYVAGGVSKLAARGLGWADALTLQDLLLAQQRVSAHGAGARLAAALVERPDLCRALALATLVIELSAFLMLVAPRPRAVVASLLAGFHLAVGLLTGIGYLGNLRLLMLLGLPWPRLLERLPVPSLPPAPPPPPRDSVVERRVALAALVIVLAALGLAWQSPIRDYTAWRSGPR